MGDFCVVDQTMVLVMMAPWGVAPSPVPVPVPPPVGPATIIAVPMPIKGSAKKVKVVGKKAVLDGDEKKWKTMAVYMSGLYVIPGMGMCKISMLGMDQKTKKVKAEGKAMVLKGSTCVVEFKPMLKAMYQPPGPVPPQMCPLPAFYGQGKFLELTNLKVKAT